MSPFFSLADCRALVFFTEGGSIFHAVCFFLVSLLLDSVIKFVADQRVFISRVFANLSLTPLSLHCQAVPM